MLIIALTKIDPGARSFPGPTVPKRYGNGCGRPASLDFAMPNRSTACDSPRKQSRFVVASQPVSVFTEDCRSCTVLVRLSMIGCVTRSVSTTSKKNPEIPNRVVGMGPVWPNLVEILPTRQQSDLAHMVAPLHHGRVVRCSLYSWSDTRFKASKQRELPNMYRTDSSK